MTDESAPGESPTQPEGAVALREALTRVPLSDRRAWARAALMGYSNGVGDTDPKWPCGLNECPHPSHWALPRLRAAWTALGSKALPAVEDRPAPIPEPMPTVEEFVAASGAADPDFDAAAIPLGAVGGVRVVSVPKGDDGAVLMAAMASTIAEGERNARRLARVRSVMQARLKRDRSKPAAVAIAPTPPVPATVIPDGWHPLPVDPSWTVTALDGPMDWLRDRRIPLMLTGPAGTGKTEGFRQSCARAGLPGIVIPCGLGLGVGALLGAWGIAPDAEGRMVNTWVDGDFQRAIRAGVPVCLDEALALKPSAAAILHDCLSSGILRNPETGEELRVKSWICATTNSVGQDVPAAHEGEVSAPMLDRFVVLATGYGTEAEEMAVLAKRAGITDGLPTLPKTARTLKPHKMGVDELRYIAGYQADINAAYADGKITRPMTRRGAFFLFTLWQAWGGTTDGFALALEGAFLDRLTPSEYRAARDIAQRRFPGMNGGAKA